MDLIKQYIVQCITAASSNLRLNNQRIEVLAMLKEVILNSKDIQHDLNQMKKITELSKMAIKLNEVLLYLNQGSVDFLKVTDKFKEHSFNLIKEMSYMLDMINPYTFRQTLDRLFEQEKKVVEIIIEPESKPGIEPASESLLTEFESMSDPDSIDTADKNIVSLDDKDNSQTFNSFESTILKPIKSIDSILNELNVDSEIPIKVEEYSKLMSFNAELSSQNGFDILSQMHNIISDCLLHLKNKSLIPSPEVIESIRACLIVIVAVVKSKEVDINNYLNRAEVFGKFLQKIKTEEVK